MQMGFMYLALFLALARSQCGLTYLTPASTITTIRPAQRSSFSNDFLVVGSLDSPFVAQLFRRQNNVWVSVRSHSFNAAIHSVAMGLINYAVGFPGIDRVNVFTITNGAEQIINPPITITTIEILGFGNATEFQDSQAQPWLFIGAPRTRELQPNGSFRLQIGAVAGYQRIGNSYTFRQLIFPQARLAQTFFGIDVDSAGIFLLIGTSGRGAELYGLNFTGLYSFLFAFPTLNPSIEGFGRRVAIGLRTAVVAGFGTFSVYFNNGAGFIEQFIFQIQSLFGLSVGCVPRVNPSSNDPIDSLALTSNEGLLFAGLNFSLIGGVRAGFVMGLNLRTLQVTLILRQPPLQADNGFGRSIFTFDGVVGVGSNNQNNVALFNFVDPPVNPNCIATDAQGCVLCRTGFFLNNQRQCVACGVNQPCLSCDGLNCTFCGSANQFFDPVTESCINCAQGNCATCNGRACLACQLGFYLTNGACRPCTDFGARCQRCTATGCTQCSSGSPSACTCCR